MEALSWDEALEIVGRRLSSVGRTLPEAFIPKKSGSTSLVVDAMESPGLSRHLQRN
jgi:hypothetical protein